MLPRLACILGKLFHVVLKQTCSKCPSYKQMGHPGTNEPICICWYTWGQSGCKPQHLETTSFFSIQRKTSEKFQWKKKMAYRRRLLGTRKEGGEIETKARQEETEYLEAVCPKSCLRYGLRIVAEGLCLLYCYYYCFCLTKATCCVEYNWVHSLPFKR